MLIGIKKFLKFLFGFCLAILLSGFIYNYLPDFLKLAKETGFFVASLVNSQNQKEIADPVLKTFHAPDLIETERGPTPLETSQDELDDLADQIDIIRRQINDLLEAKKQSSFAKASPDEEKDDEIIEDKDQIDKEEKDLKDEVDKEDKQADVDLVEINKNKPNYFQILISEVQIAGQDDDKQEFVELYNPNSEAISLTGWYLQRKTKTAQDFATYVPSNLFAGKIIYPKSYFLIAREGSFFANYADILTNNPLTEDNSLVLKNPNKETSDLLGFGLANWFLQAPAENPTNGKTIGRKWLELEKTEQDTGSNNFDFEIQLSTPKQQNIKYIVPIILPPSSGGGGGSGEIIYDKIIISEVKIAEKTGDKNVFIELYNQNNKEVDLTGWYIFRNNTSFITKTMFEGKKIPSNGYFLISKAESLWQDLSDLQFEGTLNEDDNISLKNPKGDPVDSVGWSKITENLTWGRKDNIGDFELQNPTPKSQNITFVEPPIVEIPKDKTPPEVVFGLLSAIQTNLSFPISFEITDLLGTVTPSGVNSYIFRWNDLDPAAAENWHEDLSAEVDGHPMSIQLIKQSETIPVVDGKTYYFQVKAKDNEGNWSEFLPIEPIFTKIELPPPPPIIDNTPPTGTIIINDGAEYTNTRNVVLTLSAVDDLSEVVEMKIANSSSYHDWEPYATTKDWILSASGDGIKTVRVKFKDSAGNETAVGIADTIILDTSTPKAE
jgi:hypothetical protein